MLPGRCTGQCCAVFTLGKGLLERLAAGDFSTVDPEPEHDGPFLLAMLIPMSEAEAAAKMARLGLVKAGLAPIVGPETWSFEMAEAPKLEPVFVSFERGKGGARRALLVRWGWLDQAAIREPWSAYAWCSSPSVNEALIERDIFGCRNWNEATGRCDAYAERPWLCRQYPDAEHVCQHCGFQYPLVDRDPGDETGAESIPRWSVTW